MVHKILPNRPVLAQHDFGMIRGQHYQAFVEAIPGTEFYRGFLYEGREIVFTFRGHKPDVMAKGARDIQSLYHAGLPRYIRRAA